MVPMATPAPTVTPEQPDYGPVLEEAYAISEQVLETREMLCKMFDFKKPRNVVFTPSITYSINYLIKGFLKKGDHVITSSMEHNAVIRPLVQMQELGVEFDVAQCNPDGTLAPARVEALIKPNTKKIKTNCQPTAILTRSYHCAEDSRHRIPPVMHIFIARTTAKNMAAFRKFTCGRTKGRLVSG